jgi:hypothetical protein
MEFSAVDMELGWNKKIMFKIYEEWMTKKERS